MQNNASFSYVDLTDLSDQASLDSLKVLCEKAITLQTAAVCVWPQFVADAKQLLQQTNIQVATVVNFPHGNSPLEDVLAEIQFALSQGADEIDVVFPYTLFIAGEKNTTAQFINACRAATLGKILKVILESGAFSDLKILAEATAQVCAAGVDFVKTSTGKIAVGATLDAARTILQVIRDQQCNAGLKVSGGIRTLATAESYIVLVREIMGDAWISTQSFRIGASALSL